MGSLLTGQEWRSASDTWSASKDIFEGQTLPRSSSRCLRPDGCKALRRGKDKSPDPCAGSNIRPLCRRHRRISRKSGGEPDREAGRRLSEILMVKQEVEEGRRSIGSQARRSCRHGISKRSSTSEDSRMAANSRSQRRIYSESRASRCRNTTPSMSWTSTGVLSPRLVLGQRAPDFHSTLHGEILNLSRTQPQEFRRAGK